ncbi:hypothetical protein BX666DRAFT_2026055 [Dichotomocladium elegans]|nr:hypothetical protein BX666DRAFT_2026055 [Dichotomocladium elegans]
MDHGYPMGAPVHPPIHQHPSYSPVGNGYGSKQDQMDMRMTTGPPRPSPAKTSNSIPSPGRAYTSAPYSVESPGQVYRKRGRSDSLFPPETGPFFSSTKPCENLFALDRTSL